MCGIIAYSGHRPSVPVIVEGLKKLEYRGYDSAGLAFALSGQITSTGHPASWKPWRKN